MSANARSLLRNQPLFGNQFLDRCRPDKPRSGLELHLARFDALSEPKHRVVGVPGRPARQTKGAYFRPHQPGLGEDLRPSKFGKPGSR